MVTSNDSIRRSLRRGASLAAASCLLLAACATPSTGNAPPAVVEACRQEVMDLTSIDELPPPDESLPETAGPGGTGIPDTTGIDEARAAQMEEEAPHIATWPEDALMYRCFSSRGVPLTEEQTRVLARWQGRPRTPQVP